MIAVFASTLTIIVGAGAYLYGRNVGRQQGFDEARRIQRTITNARRIAHTNHTTSR